MRRKDREITDFHDIMDIMNKCDTCRLAFFDQEGYRGSGQSQNNLTSEGKTFPLYNSKCKRAHLFPETIFPLRPFGVRIEEIIVEMSVDMIGYFFFERRFHQIKQVEGLSGKQVRHKVFYVSDGNGKHDIPPVID